MSDTTIPYATQQPQGLTAREIFGLIVRTAGLGLTLWGGYSLLGLMNLIALDTTVPVFVALTAVSAACYIAVGLALLKGEWVVRFAYGRHLA